MPQWLGDLGTWLTESRVGAAIVKVAIVGMIAPGLVAFLVWLERRAAAWFQDRMGPNRVGPFGLLQSIADLLKFLLKEDVFPRHVDRAMYLIAPTIAVITPLVVLSLIPFAERFAIADVDTGILAVFAFSGVGVYSLALGGWSSNSKYALIGAVRASAQLISYEICLGLAALSVFVVMGSLRLEDVVRMQADGWTVHGAQAGAWTRILDWNVWKQPVGAVIFLVAAFAETNRTPFDLPEAESELAAGYHVEYSSMKFALFFLGEYVAMVAMSALFVTIYLGGWTLFGLEDAFAGSAWQTGVQLAIFVAKTMCMLFVFIWVRWTVPRFRYDQLMRLGWKRLMPATLGWLAVTAIGVALVR